MSPGEALALARRLRQEGKTLRMVVGYFDPLLAAHAQRLADARKDASALVVVVTDPPRPILPARARAELVAALAAVDHVVLPGGEPLDPLFDGAEVLRSEAEDLQITGTLIQHVQERQRAL